MLNIVFPLAHANEDCAPVADVDDFYTTGWGYTKSNERYQSRTTIDKSNVDQLTLKRASELSGGRWPGPGLWRTTDIDTNDRWQSHDRGRSKVGWRLWFASR